MTEQYQERLHRLMSELDAISRATNYLTQEELAKLIGMNRSRLSELESGQEDAMTEHNLAPCRYCGESDTRVETAVMYVGKHPYSFRGSVTCNNCELSATGHGTHRKEAVQEAVKAWNQDRRTP